MKVKNKILTAMVFGTILSGLIIPNKANAVLQSNGGTPATRNLNDWLLQIRQMQEIGGTLGRTDTINTTNLTSGATDLDIHMEKNTEYGAMAILSASAYGNPNKINDGETTTGNSTGIVININSEWVSACTEFTNSSILQSALDRYKDLYSSSSYLAKAGDAINETSEWHNAVNGGPWDLGNYGCGLLRAYSGSIFSYHCYRAYSNIPDVLTVHYSRACIVVGTGL